MDHSHTAVLAEWLTEPGSHDERRPDAALPEHGRTAPCSRPPGHRAAVSAAVANLNAGALAFVMGTGIVSTALYVNGADTASWRLLAACHNLRKIFRHAGTAGIAALAG
ncbi:hypothetical protein [Streptomyces mirabilis]